MGRLNLYVHVQMHVCVYLHVNMHVNVKLYASSLSCTHPIPFLHWLPGTLLKAPLVSASPNLSPIQCPLQPPPAACSKAQLQLPSLNFYDVHGVSEWQTIPGQWPWQTAAGALVPAGHTKLFSSQLVYLGLRDGKSAPIWSRLQFDPQSFEAPAPALIKKK